MITIIIFLILASFAVRIYYKEVWQVIKKEQEEKYKIQ